MSAQIESDSKNLNAEFLKGKSIEELLAIISMASAEAKKAVKSIAKAPKEKATKKGSMPTGSTPPQLYKNNMWVNYVLNDANTNGWPSFTVQGKKETTEIAASVRKDGAHVFEKDNKPFNRKQAMSLSKLYWAPKENKGTRHELYQAFEAQYVPPQAGDLVSEPKEPKEPKAPKAPKEPKAPKVVKTEEEKEAESVAKKAAKKAEAAAKKAEAAVKAAEAAKAAAAVPTTVVKVASGDDAATKEATKEPTKEKKAKKAKKAEEEKDTFTCEDDGAVHEWDWKGKKFLRNYNNQVWQRIDNGEEYEAGDWCGVYDPKTNKIDDSVEEPSFEDDE